MLLFLFTLVVVVLGVGVFAHYNPGTMDVTVRTFQFTGIPDWEIVAVAAGVPLVAFLLYVIYASIRIRLLRRALAPAAVEPQPGARRTWTPSGD